MKTRNGQRRSEIADAKSFPCWVSLLSDGDFINVIADIPAAGTELFARLAGSQ